MFFHWCRNPKPLAGIFVTQGNQDKINDCPAQKDHGQAQNRRHQSLFAFFHLLALAAGKKPEPAAVNEHQQSERAAQAEDDLRRVN